MAFVYAGKLLRVDLGAGTLRFESISEADVRRYLLGSGLAARIYYQEMDPGLDPLHPDSPLLAMNGLLTGTFSPTGCRSSWCGRSPLTGIWNEANMGGHWGAELRFAGLDGLIVTGRAAEPVYLWIHDGQAEIRPAGHLWGLEHFDVFERLRGETDPKAQVACIGPAGENLVRLAGVMQGGQEHARSGARGGMGALLGSKNLKAIVVRGSDRPQYPDPKAFQAFVKQINAFIKDNSVGMSQLGTPGGIIGTELTGDLPLKNWSEGSWKEETARISGQRIAETIFARHTHCFACPIGCGKTVKIDDGPYAGVYGHGPEYETLAGFGGNCQCDDLNAIARMNDLCNRYGLDTISTSAALAFAMEAYEKGLLSREEAGGLDLTWGNAPAMIEAVGQIARREGVGEILADGVRAAAARLGPEAEAFAVHVKGMEMPYHDPRAFVSMAPSYATAVRGACHLEGLSYWAGYGVRWPGWYEPETYDPHDSTGQGKVAVDFQNYVGVYNPLGLCKFIIKATITPGNIAELVNAALGWDWTAADVVETGERLFNLKRLIDLRLGVTVADDTLPRRLLAEPRPSGGAAGVLPDLPAMLEEYYRVRGWDADGTPGAERLAALNVLP
ncbi:MAG: aldehyde ferredoxin oxidoreductase family protein [Anaerolineae bacterium]|jgi:aldehyde:ferredoxin oxidoreductase|nr:aldehyde ferredoxin oxidoreductase family protein [Anaerolineae bacterium]